MSRNHINALSGDVLIALPGGAGTVSEVMLAVRYGKPIVLFGPGDAFGAFPPEPPRATELRAVAEFVLSARCAGG
jgi:predicted Rossmann-fold nucleotide-binding protein